MLKELERTGKAGMSPGLFCGHFEFLIMPKPCVTTHVMGVLSSYIDFTSLLDFF